MVGEYNIEDLKTIDADNIYDKIEITFEEYDDSKELTLEQSLTTNIDISNQRKFRPLSMWEFQDDWDYVSDENTFQDSVWKKDENNKINEEAYKKYFSSKKFKGKNHFTVTFRKNDPLLGEREEYTLIYESHDFTKEWGALSFSNGIILTTSMYKGKNIANEDKNILTFPLIKSGSSYLIKIKFGKILKTYTLDSGASDMTLDDKTYQYLKETKQIKIQNNLSKQQYILADGSKVEYKRIKVPAFSINGIVINNITAVLVQNGNPLLLGKSFLDSFKSWRVDNKNNMLTVELY